MINLGMIGTGRIAKRAVKEIAEVKDIKLTAVYNPNEDHAKTFAKDNGIDQAYSEIDKFLESIDALYIASPHGTHYDYVKQALELGKHVICEKPLTLSEKQTISLYEIASDNKLVLIEAVKTAYSPGFKKLCEVVESGAIGEVVDVEAAFTRLTEGNVRELTDTKTGGAFTEFGTYTMLPIFRFLGTDYTDIKYKTIKAGNVDGYTKAHFNYSDRFATAKCGLTVKSEGQLLISGTKGYILVPSPWWLTKYFEVRYEDPRKIDKYEFAYEGDGLRYEFQEFAKRISVRNCDKIERNESITRSRVFENFLSNR
ncbi:Gfo/Idh/MocA family protein, partial [Butyrivibrio sp. XPD2002]|uniref:Gfo/Idh/MocA family protein n=1 Tax=Butyrivibrio sp. XPD2002 TaxID=1280665 RepID=UPI00040C9352